MIIAFVIYHSLALESSFGDHFFIEELTSFLELVVTVRAAAVPGNCPSPSSFIHQRIELER